MIYYASNTQGHRNLEAIFVAGFGVLLSPGQHKDPPRNCNFFSIENGCFRCYNSGVPFNHDGFVELVEKHGGAARFVVIPDKVADRESLAFSRQWIPRLRHLPNLLLAVQDGMTADDVGAFVRNERIKGIFLGGSIEWKLKTLYSWGMAAHALGCYYHVGRVNTVRRIRLCAEAGAHSVDGTSATMYSCTVPLLDAARKQPSLLTPRAVSV